jgi:hypothetical protein
MDRVPQCHPDRPHYLRGMCRPCYDHDWAFRDPVRLARIRARKRQYYHENHEHLSQKQREYQKTHRKECTERVRVWRARHHSRLRDSWLRETYDITLHDYNEMLTQQGGLCAICRQEPSGKRARDRVLQVDHNHKLGRVRGLLCIACNARLAIIEDTSFIQSAQRYLRDYETSKNVI